MSTLSRESRQEKKAKATLRAQFALKQRHERIDFEYDVLIPMVEAIKAGKEVLGLDPGVAFDIVIDSAPTYRLETQKPEDGTGDPNQPGGGSGPEPPAAGS